MNTAWNCYLLAFKNMFDYKNTAERKELNWFCLFMFIFWMLTVMIFIIFNIFTIISGKNIDMPIIFLGFFIFAGIYFIAHYIPLTSLIKRRFNLITPNKPVFFIIWLVFWIINFVIFLIQLAFNLIMILNPAIIDSSSALLIIPFVFAGQIFGLLTWGTIIFLMIRKNPIC
ncbi:hypothetical protein IJ596_05460 [bacterium]|nr:hypothetical protein [bacterium]